MSNSNVGTVKTDLNYPDKMWNKCGHCENKFEIESIVNKHIKATFQIKGGTNVNRGGQFKCGHCENSFNTKSKMKEHIKTTLQIKG